MLEACPDTVTLIVKPFPSLDQQSSLLAAAAALAAHAQGRLWTFREQLLRLDGPASTTDLKAIAEQCGLDIPLFFRDLTSPGVQNLLVGGINDGVHRGVRATPTVFINAGRLPRLDIGDLLNAVRAAVRG